MTEYEVIGIVVSGLVIIIGLFMSIFIPLLNGVLKFNNIVNGLANLLNLTNSDVVNIKETLKSHEDELAVHDKAIRDIQFNCVRTHPASNMKEEKV